MTPRPFVPEDRLPVPFHFPIQDLPDRVRRDQASIRAADENGGVEMTDGETEGERVGPGDTDAGVKAAERVEADIVVFFRRDKGEKWFAEDDGRRCNAGSRGENTVGAWGAEVGQAHEAIHGRGGEKVRM